MSVNLTELGCVLTMCQQQGERFTLREIVCRVQEERPELIAGFPDIWGELIRSKRIKIFKAAAGEPSLYEVARAG